MPHGYGQNMIEPVSLSYLDDSKSEVEVAKRKEGFREAIRGSQNSREDAA